MIVPTKELQEVLKQVSIKMNKPVEVVTIAYRSYWEFILRTIRDLPQFDNITEEEFKQLRTSFNIPSLGKVYTTYDIIERIQQLYERNKIKEDNSNDELSDNNCR